MFESKIHFLPSLELVFDPDGILHRFAEHAAFTVSIYLTAKGIQKFRANIKLRIDGKLENLSGRMIGLEEHGAHYEDQDPGLEGLVRLYRVAQRRYRLLALIRRIC